MTYHNTPSGTVPITHDHKEAPAQAPDRHVKDSGDPSQTKSTTATEGGRGRATLLVALLGAGVLAALIGAYLDWRMWLVYSGLLITVAAGSSCWSVGSSR